MSRRIVRQLASRLLGWAPYGSFVHAVGALSFVRLIGGLVLFLSQILLARWMGRDAFGIYSYAWAWVAVLASVANLGLGTADGEATGGADLIPLRPLGVPLADLEQDRSAYFDVHHTDNDTLDKIDPEALRQVTAAFATAAEWAANREARLLPAPVPAEERP